MDQSLLPYRPCVGVMAINREGYVWVGRRAEARYHNEGQGNWWQMPQGGIDEGEDPAESALRELREETGMHSVEIVARSPQWYAYDLPRELVGKAWGGRFRGQKQVWFAVRFLGDDSEIEIAPRHGAETEFDDWKWVPIGELDGLIVPFKREVYAQVVAAFAHLARPLQR
jgi:putative (di)nucleoside polyphosphate hydrolase